MNKVALLHQQLVNANKDLGATNEALHKLRTAMDEDIGSEPTINDYYEPSDEMKIGGRSFSKQTVVLNEFHNLCRL